MSDVSDFSENPVDEVATRALARFAGLIRRIDWFGRVATPLDPPTRRMARRYLDTLGFPDIVPAWVEDWLDAAAAAESLDYNSPAWDAEEALRAELVATAEALLGEAALAALLQPVEAVTATVAGEAASMAAARLGVDDEAFLTAAVGGAVQAAHLAALVLIAGEDAEDHPFFHKFRLFEAGRWPLGIAGASFNLF
ncbi:MAG: hypothetical protein ACOY99_12685 [Pseudomonadota bacterium]|jgi:hypothetical protein